MRVGMRSVTGQQGGAGAMVSDLDGLSITTSFDVRSSPGCSAIEGGGEGTVLGNVSTFIGNALGGLSGRQNVAAWVVAGIAAYFLWVKPERDAIREWENQVAVWSQEDCTIQLDRQSSWRQGQCFAA